jgi:toxin HigB-1
MIESFADKGTEDIFNGVNSTDARRLLPREMWKIASRKLDQIDSATQLDDLKIPPGNRLELLRGDRRGQHSIRINNQYRICFEWTLAGPSNVEIVDYH